MLALVRKKPCFMLADKNQIKHQNESTTKRVHMPTGMLTTPENAQSCQISNTTHTCIPLLVSTQHLLLFCLTFLPKSQHSMLCQVVSKKQTVWNYKNCPDILCAVFRRP